MGQNMGCFEGTHASPKRFRPSIVDLTVQITFTLRIYYCTTLNPSGPSLFTVPAPHRPLRSTPLSWPPPPQIHATLPTDPSSSSSDPTQQASERRAATRRGALLRLHHARAEVQASGRSTRRAAPPRASERVGRQLLGAAQASGSRWRHAVGTLGVLQFYR